MDSLMKPNPLLRRRNSISTSVVVPTILNFQTKPQHAASFPTATPAAVAATSSSSSSSSSSTSQSFTSVDFELISIKPISYTSLKDLLPSATAVQSPKPAAAYGGAGGNSRYEISISNRLVKQAAWAYLQPMSTSPGSADRHLFRRLWTSIAGGDCLENPLTHFVRSVNGYIIRVVTRAFDWLLRAVWVRNSR